MYLIGIINFVEVDVIIDEELIWLMIKFSLFKLIVNYWKFKMVVLMFLCVCICIILNIKISVWVNYEVN